MQRIVSFVLHSIGPKKSTALISITYQIKISRHNLSHEWPLYIATFLDKTPDQTHLLRHQSGHVRPLIQFVCDINLDDAISPTNHVNASTNFAVHSLLVGKSHMWSLLLLWERREFWRKRPAYWRPRCTNWNFEYCSGIYGYLTFMLLAFCQISSGSKFF